MTALPPDKRERYIRAGNYAQIAQRYQKHLCLPGGTVCDVHSDIQCALASPDHSGLFSELQLSRHPIRFEKSRIEGWGVRAAEPIREAEPIIEYKGEWVRAAIVDVREKQNEAKGNYGSYIFRVGPDAFIDATDRGGAARYINHSCDPNCESRTLRYKGEYRIVICAKRNIEPGEELTYDYKLPFEQKEKRIQCLCGAKKCRIWMNYFEGEVRPNVETEEELEQTDEEEDERSVHRLRSAPSSPDLEEIRARQERDRMLMADLAILVPGLDFTDRNLRELLHITTDTEDEADSPRGRKGANGAEKRRRKTPVIVTATDPLGFDDSGTDLAQSFADL
jgi:hypothetical protein